MTVGDMGACVQFITHLKAADQILDNVARFAPRTLDFQAALAAPLIARTTRSGGQMIAES
jgi:hypothetical protein